MNAEMDLGTNKKAFQINLDAKKYGTFAEIGAVSLIGTVGDGFDTLGGGGRLRREATTTLCA